MTRWIVLPLVSGLLLGGSAFLDALERTTIASAELAHASEDAPASTRAAVEEVESLPAIAVLTGRQADAFAALADALEISAARVVDLNASLSSQVEGLRDLHDSIEDLDPAVACLRGRIERLNAASSGGPAAIEQISATLRRVDDSQKKSLRHLRSINRKLTALGVLAAVTGVEPPPRPGEAPRPRAEGAPGSVRC